MGQVEDDGELDEEFTAAQEGDYEPDDSLLDDDLRPIDDDDDDAFPDEARPVILDDADDGEADEDL